MVSALGEGPHLGYKYIRFQDHVVERIVTSTMFSPILGQDVRGIPKRIVHSGIHKLGAAPFLVLNISLGGHEMLGHPYVHVMLKHFRALFTISDVRALQTA